MQNLKDTNPHLALKLIVAQLNVIAAQQELALEDLTLVDKLTVQLQKLLENQEGYNNGYVCYTLREQCK